VPWKSILPQAACIAGAGGDIQQNWKLRPTAMEFDESFWVELVNIICGWVKTYIFTICIYLLYVYIYYMYLYIYVYKWGMNIQTHTANSYVDAAGHEASDPC